MGQTGHVAPDRCLRLPASAPQWGRKTAAESGALLLLAPLAPPHARMRALPDDRQPSSKCVSQCERARAGCDALSQAALGLRRRRRPFVGGRRRRRRHETSSVSSALPGSAFNSLCVIHPNVQWWKEANACREESKCCCGGEAWRLHLGGAPRWSAAGGRAAVAVQKVLGRRRSGRAAGMKGEVRAAGDGAALQSLLPGTAGRRRVGPGERQAGRKRRAESGSARRPPPEERGRARQPAGARRVSSVRT